MSTPQISPYSFVLLCENEGDNQPIAAARREYLRLITSPPYNCDLIQSVRGNYKTRF